MPHILCPTLPMYFVYFFVANRATFPKHFAANVATWITLGR
jgi:hypothetical protein